MAYLTDNLKNNYTAVLQSDTDKAFYKSADRYIDFIVKTPVLVKILDKSENEYKQKHSEIWSVKKSFNEKELEMKKWDKETKLAVEKYEKELDEQEERTRKLEKFSLFAADYCWVLNRIYIPLEDYKTSDNMNSNHAICAKIMLGIIQVKKDSPENVKMFGRRYVGKRPEYESRLKQFHQDFLPIVEKIKETPEPEIDNAVFERVFFTSKENSRPVIFIDDKFGIYQKFNKDSAYAIRKNSKRFNLIKYLQTKDFCQIAELSALKHQKSTDTMKSIKLINKLFRQNTGVPFDLISHNDTSGYSLNKTELDIQRPPSV